MLVLLVGVTGGSVLAVTGCEAIIESDRVRPVPSRGPDRVIDNERVRQITYKGHCLSTADYGGISSCWPCGGGTVKPCNEWYETIDGMGELPQSGTIEHRTISVLALDTGTGEVSEHLVSVDPGTLTGSSMRIILEASAADAAVDAVDFVPVGGDLPGSDVTELTAIVAAMLAADGVGWNLDAIRAAYGLGIPMGDPFEYRARLIGADTVADTIDLVLFVREDQVLPRPRAGLDLSVLPLGPIGLPDPGVLALRISGHMAAVADEVEGLFPVGTVAEYANAFGDWRMESILDAGGGYALELRLGGIVVGVW